MTEDNVVEKAKEFSDSAYKSLRVTDRGVGAEGNAILFAATVPKRETELATQLLEASSMLKTIVEAQEWRDTVEKIGELLEEKPKEHAKDHGYACELINEIWAVIKVNHYSALPPIEDKT